MKRFIGGILAMGLIQAHAGAIYGGTHDPDQTDSGAIYGGGTHDQTDSGVILGNGLIEHIYVRPPAALTDAGGTGASGVCCSDLPAQHSEVLIASDTVGSDPQNPPNFGGSGEDDGNDEPAEGGSWGDGFGGIGAEGFDSFDH